MDHNDLQRQGNVMKHKGRNVVWSLAMDKCLIETLVIQAQKGNKIDKSYNEVAHTAACIAVNSRFNLNLNNQKVVNRMKTIKKRYNIMRGILSHDGFRWNPHTKMIECNNDELWKRYTKAHPDAKGFQGKQIEMYEELEIICGNYQAPCRRTRMADGTQQQFEIKNEQNSTSFISPSSEDESESEDTQSFNEHPEYGQGHAPDRTQEPPSIPPLKRPRTSDSVQEAMLTVASSITRLADALERNKINIDSRELLEAVMEIDGLEEGKQMYAFEYLNADPVKARAFMTYDARMRKIYMFRQFWWWK